MMVFGLLSVHCTGLQFRYKGVRFSGMARNSLTIISVLAKVIAGVIITVLPTSMTVAFVGGLEVCVFQDTFKNVVMILSWTSLAVTIWSCISLNVKVKCRHREDTDIAIAT
ncbi:hypothetical protein GGI18_003909, partial [Coemansia linderi]